MDNSKGIVGISGGGGGGSGGIVVATAPTATDVPITAKGAAAQTADLQQWLDSAGAIRTRVRSDGCVEIRHEGTAINFYNAAGTQYQGAIQRDGSTGGLNVTAVLGDLRLTSGGTGGDVLLNAPNTGKTVRIYNTVSGNTPLTVKTVASSTRWIKFEDSTGFEIGYIRNGGNSTNGLAIFSSAHLDITAPSGYGIFFTGGVNVGAGHTGVSALILTPAAGSTVPTLRIRNSSSVTQMEFTPAGLLKWSVADNVQTTVGGAGAASAPPATPSKYLKVVGDDGVTYVIPAYLAA